MLDIPARLAFGRQLGIPFFIALKLVFRFDTVAGSSAPTMAGRDVFDLIFALFASPSVNFAMIRTRLEFGVVITPASFAATNL